MGGNVGVAFILSALLRCAPSCFPLQQTSGEGCLTLCLHRWNSLKAVMTAMTKDKYDVRICSQHYKHPFVLLFERFWSVNSRILVENVTLSLFSFCLLPSIFSTHRLVMQPIVCYVVWSLCSSVCVVVMYRLVCKCLCRCMHFK